jgi:hypothetical protein
MGCHGADKAIESGGPYLGLLNMRRLYARGASGRLDLAAVLDEGRGLFDRRHPQPRRREPAGFAEC